MNGVHDLGGMDGFGPIAPEPDEPVFHADWERRMFALFVASLAGGHFNVDEFRHAIERSMAPDEYLRSSYYEHWLHGVETLLVEKGRVTREELARGEARAVPDAPVRLERSQVAALVAAGASCRVDADVAPRFAVGDAVRVRNEHPHGHTRMPRYVRGRRGTIALDHGVFVFADASAHGEERPQHVYSVRFTARELWGSAGHPADVVHVDLWDDHLEPAPRRDA